jgi:hypothetical protein
MRREVYDLVGGIDTDIYGAPDYDLCLKLAEVTEIYHLRQPLYYYREHVQSMSQSTRSKLVEYSARAVTNALIRRGLADRYYLNVLPDGGFQLLERG